MQVPPLRVDLPSICLCLRHHPVTVGFVHLLGQSIPTADLPGVWTDSFGNARTDDVLDHS